jgi:pyruvate dehydrogenase E1 component
MDALHTQRWNMLHPTEEQRIPYVTQCLANEPGVFVAASDYMKSLPDSLGAWLPKPMFSLGTDGFGRSENRQSLRDFFEVDYRYVTLATLKSLANEGQIGSDTLNGAMEELEIDPNKPNPMTD